MTSPSTQQSSTALRAIEAARKACTVSKRGSVHAVDPGRGAENVPGSARGACEPAEVFARLDSRLPADGG